LMPDDMELFDDVEYEPPPHHQTAFSSLFMTRTAAALPDSANKNLLDSLLTNTLQLLLPFLQCPTTDDTIKMLHLSLLPDWLNELARNDSITDMVERKDLYYAMFELVRFATQPNSGLLACLFLEKRRAAIGGTY
jgi:hypothetical protein